MNGPLISDILASPDIPSFPWTRSLIIIGAIVIVGAITVTVMIIRKEHNWEENIWLAIIFTLAIAGASLFFNWINHENSGRKEAQVATELSDVYGVTILEDSGHGFGFLPTKPAQGRDFNVLVDGVVTPCTIATSSDRYSISCEQGKDVVVLTPKETP